MTNAIEVSAVHHHYADRQALAGVSFSVAPGQLFGVIGPNGSGKTTMFSLLNTSRRIQNGSITIGGVSVADDPVAARRQIGIVFQRPTTDRYLTCRENLALHGALQGIRHPALRGRVDTALTESGLLDRADELAGALSGGLGRRLELARALLHLPAVLLLDEPAGALDPGARGDLWGRLATWRRERGLTVLVTTHDMGEAEQCDRLVLLDAGQVIGTGTPAELTRTLGRTIVTIRTTDVVRVSQIVREKFSAEPMVVGGEVRFATPEAHALVGPLAAACGAVATSITVGQPTLEDVFVALTGRRFSEQSA